MYTCRECDQEINEGTEICPHCGADLTVFTAEEHAARKTPLLKTVVRWVSLLGVLVWAAWIFIWYLLKFRIP
jgi:hypothetical protein